MYIYGHVHAYRGTSTYNVHGNELWGIHTYHTLFACTVHASWPPHYWAGSQLCYKKLNTKHLIALKWPLYRVASIDAHYYTEGCGIGANKMFTPTSGVCVCVSRIRHNVTEDNRQKQLQ